MVREFDRCTGGEPAIGFPWVVRGGKEGTAVVDERACLIFSSFFVVVKLPVFCFRLEGRMRIRQKGWPTPFMGSCSTSSHARRKGAASNVVILLGVWPPRDCVIGGCTLR